MIKSKLLTEQLRSMSKSYRTVQMDEAANMCDELADLREQNAELVESGFFHAGAVENLAKKVVDLKYTNAELVEALERMEHLYIEHPVGPTGHREYVAREALAKHRGGG